MKDNNLDDLILTDPELDRSKSKVLMALLALVILLIITGAVLAKIIFDSSENSNSQNSYSLMDKKVKSVKDKSLNNNDLSRKNLNSDLSPLNDKEILSDIDMASLDKKDSSNKELSNKSSKPLNSKQDSVLGSATELNKKVIKRVTHKNKTRNKREEIKTTKPKKLQYKQPKVKQVYGGAGNIYVQVGSFRKGPKQPFINKIIKEGFRFRIKEVNGFKRVLVGPFKNSREVNRFLPIIKSKISSDVIIKR